MRVESQKLAIELKYKTRHLLGIVGGEIYDLGDQAAQDLGRYDFFKDIERLERSYGPVNRDLAQQSF